jgi:hypothetical protein
MSMLTRDPSPHRRTARRIFAVAIAAGVLVLCAAGPAMAQVRPHPDGSKQRVGVGDVTVKENEAITKPVVAVDGTATVAGSTTEGVFVISGDAVISGHVDGNVIVIDGNARISGYVGDGVTVFSGRAIIDDGATVHGDVQSTKEPRVARGAKVTGDTKHIDITGMFTALGFSLLAALWFAVTVCLAVFGAIVLALFGRAFDVGAKTARTSAGKSIGLGLLVAIALPVIGALAIVSLVGIPLGVGTLGALGILEALGYVTSCLFLGRLFIKPPRNIFGAFFAGFGILRLVALLPGIGVAVWVAAVIFGLGALTLAAWRASHGSSTPPDADSTAAETGDGGSDRAATEPVPAAVSAPAAADTPSDKGSDSGTEPGDAAPAKDA